MTLKTLQQIINETREEFEKRVRGGEFHISPDVPLTGVNFDKIFNWHTSTLQAFIEAEIAMEKKKPPFTGHIGNDTNRAYDMGQNEGYNQAKEETISHLKELLTKK